MVSEQDGMKKVEEAPRGRMEGNHMLGSHARARLCLKGNV